MNDRADGTTAERFRDALRELETSSSPDALVELYAEQCTLGNVVQGEKFDGHDGVREFWSTYREQFDTVESDFAVVSGDSDGAVLEWTTTGTAEGREVTYRGATVLETDDGMIVRSMAYYDPSDLGRKLVGSADAEGGPGRAARTGSAEGDRDTDVDGDGEAGEQGWSGPAPADEQAAESSD